MKDVRGLAAHDLLPLLGDADEKVAQEAEDALERLGEEAVPLLRRAREEGPGRLRARALTVLARIGGEAALSRADVAAVERLVRVRLSDDRPGTLETCWSRWIAVPGGDRDGVVEALGLARPRPATFALARDVLDQDVHHRPVDSPRRYGRVFVTPELDGWTLVLGAWCDPCGEERAEDVLRLCTQLSARYGRAQAYYYGSQGDGSAWLIAEAGAVVRRYCETGEGEDELLTLGEPLPLERARRLELGLSPEWDAAQESEEDEEEWQWAASGLAPEIAAALGVSPLGLGPDTPSRGTGVLALTPYGTAHGVPPGAYRV
ncbi:MULTISPECIES: hypothetical protein [unclassified Streptomyces]|uniref:HEAT repeat domain-containing protein n=1 Tax=unclassified Streptomyces TaxID=2593676 RepID=UPI0021752DF3|nr:MULTISPECIES: hypothetical protein [unclassified Streptomyces]MCZ2526053.1 hypothetical protein [Streptomyces sp. HB2AG]